jgi:DNA-binding SARP family transcriptional activator
MEFRILGPLDVEDDGRAVELGGTRQRALLAILLLRRGTLVSAGRLIEELYGAEPPATAAKSLQAHVSRLRKALSPADRVESRAGGYALRLEPGELDADRFEAKHQAGRTALAEGRPHDAAAAFAEALALWRGPPLADLAYEDFAQGELARLEELHLSCLEDRIDADLALGQNARAIADLEPLISSHPLRERLRCQLILALYRSGRQSDALEEYRSARAALIEELGIEPGRAMRDLHRAILRQDPALDAPAGAGAVPASTSFVGREPELAELIAGLDDAFAGRGQLFLLAGEPGIGKSRLAEELAVQARLRGARVLVGRSWEAGGAPAYWPWVQSLRAYVSALEPDALRTQLGDGGADLAQMLPELRQLIPDLPPPPAAEAEGARFRLFDAAARFLRNASREQPLVLILDDLHAADEPSLLLLRFIGRELAGSRLVIVGAYRNVDPALRDSLVSTLSELGREPATHRIDVGGLTGEAIASYIALETGTEPAASAVAEIQAETEGNPLFVVEVVRLLAAEGRLGDAERPLRIPPRVQEAIGSRVRRLTKACHRTLVLASVLGRDFTIDALDHMSELPRDELFDALDEGITEGVVAEAPGASGRFRFAHVLIRDVLYDELTPTQRMRLHRRAGTALEELYGDGLEPHLAELAHHFGQAAPAGDTQRAIDYARRAGDRAARQLAFEEAARLYETALPLTSGNVGRSELLLALGDARARAGDTPASKRAFREAAELAERLELPDQLARAALGYGGRLVWDVSRDDPSIVPLLERALAAMGEEETPLRVRLLARLAGGPLRDSSFSPLRKAALAREALDIARRLGDPSTLAYALVGYTQANLSPDVADEDLELSRELVVVALEAGEKERAFEGHEDVMLRLLSLGDRPGATVEFEAISALAEELRQPAQEWVVLVYRGLWALLDGRFGDAEAHIAQALAAGERAQSWNAAVSHGLQLYVLRRAQGRLADAEEMVRGSAGRYPTYAVWRCVLADTVAELGQEEEARAELQSLAVDDFASVPFDEEWLVSMTILADAVTTLGDAGLAERLYRLLHRHAHRVAVSYPEICTGSVARSLANLATTLERWEVAEHHFEGALELNERIGARPWLARTQFELARMLRGRGAPTDDERAGELERKARETAAEIGLAL